MPSIRTVRSTCRICYNTCGVLITLTDGRPTAVAGDPENPMNRGRLCPKGQASLEYLTHPDRLTRPLRRVGERGEGRWEPITWDQALDETARKLQRVREQYGILAIALLRGASKGMLDNYLARFGNTLGTPNISSPAPYCFVPMANASRLTYGCYLYPDYEYPPRAVTLWGSNPEETHFTDFHLIEAAREKGARLMVIDPLPSTLAREADLWLRPRPGTDLALALGMMNRMIANGWLDHAFVERWTTGFDHLKTHVQDYPPERVAEITWIPPDRITAAAELYATCRPGCIGWGNGIETTVNAFQTCRAVAMLRALSGNLGVPGGDVNFTTPGGLRRGDPEFVRQNDIPSEIRNRRVSMDEAMMPIIYYTLPQNVVRAILDDTPYPIRAAYVQGANPLTHYPDAAETRAALMKLDALIVTDMFMTPTAALADIVLPAGSYLEADSVEQPWHYPIAAVQQKVAQVGEAWPDAKILNELAKRLDLERFVFEDLHDPLNHVLEPAGITFDEFRRIGFLTAARQYRHYLREGFATPSGKVELYSAQMAEWGFDPLPAYREAPESPLSDPALARDYPLVMTSRKTEAYRHSGGRQIASLRRREPDPVVRLHPDAAAARGIAEGQWVRISTTRGHIRQRARLCAELDPRVVEIAYAWWFPEAGVEGLFDWQRANVNVLTGNRPPFCPEMGTPSLRGIVCNVSKEEDPDE